MTDKDPREAMERARQAAATRRRPPPGPSESPLSIRRIGPGWLVSWCYVVEGELLERSEECRGAATLRRVLRDMVRRPDYEKIVQDVLRRGVNRSAPAKTVRAALREAGSRP